MNPDGRDGKHASGSGDGWDLEADMPADCPCTCHAPDQELADDYERNDHR